MRPTPGAATLAARRTTRRATWMALAVLMLATAVGCNRDVPRPERDEGQVGSTSAPIFLMPSEGAVLTQPRIEIALQVPEMPDGAHLAVHCGEVDISDHFDPPTRRMRRLGGGILALTSIDLAALPGCDSGLLTARAGDSPMATRSFAYRPPDGRIEVRVLENGVPIPARLIIRGLGGTPDPDFVTPGAEFVDPRSRGEHRVFLDSVSGEEIILLPAGRYRLLATHGIEYTIAQQEVHLQPGTTIRRQVELQRVIDTSGWISADLHVHASPSWDCFVPLRDRVAGYLAAGVEVLAGSDHHVLTDYGPTIRSIPGASRRLASFVGVETEIRAGPGGPVGHWTLFPFAPQPGRIVEPWSIPRVPEPADIYRLFREGEEARGSAPARAPGLPGGIIELNHPRGLMSRPGAGVRGTDLASYFTSSGFAPDHPATWSFLDRRDASGRFANSDFDAIEVLNRFSFSLYREVRLDWFALLNAGRHYTGTANSDSHHRVMIGPGFPRNYVRVDDPDTPEAFDSDRFNNAVRVGRVAGTTGPMIDLLIGAAGPGDTVEPTDGRLKVLLHVRAAPWIPVREVRLVLGGQVVRRFTPERLDGIIERLSEEIEVAVGEDSWILAEAGQPLDAPDTPEGGIYGEVAPGFVPIAFTNPILIDADGDGWGRPH